MNKSAIGRSWKQARAELFTTEEILESDLRVKKILESIQAKEEKFAEKIHPETGKILNRDIRPFEFKFRGEKITVNQPGWYSAEGDDGILTREDCKIADEVLKILKARCEGKNSPKIHPETGKILNRDIRLFEFKFRGEKIIIDMPGWYPDDDSDAIFTRADMAVHDKALTILKARYEEETAKNLSANVAFA